MKKESAKGLLLFSVIIAILCLTDFLTIFVSLLFLTIGWIWRGRAIKKLSKHKEYEASSLKMDYDISKIILIVASIFFMYHFGKSMIYWIGYIS